MSINDLQRILQVLDKYVVERTPAEVSQALTAELDVNPLDVYAIACRYNLHGIANLAAKTLLKLPCSRLYGLDEDFSTLIIVEQYERLVKYRILAGDTAVHAVRNFPRSDTWTLHLAPPTTAGFRQSATACECSGTVALGDRGYCAPWIEAFKEVCCTALVEKPGCWETILNDGHTGIRVVSFVHNSKCNYCIREVKGLGEVASWMRDDVKEALDKVYLLSDCSCCMSQLTQQLISVHADKVAVRRGR